MEDKAANSQGVLDLTSEWLKKLDVHMKEAKVMADQLGDAQLGSASMIANFAIDARKKHLDLLVKIHQDTMQEKAKTDQIGQNLTSQTNSERAQCD